MIMTMQFILIALELTIFQKKKIIGRKNIVTNISRTQAYN